MIVALATVLLAGHLLAMNVASAGPLVWAWLVAHGPAGDERRAALARRMATLSLAGFIAGIVLGSALLAAPNAGLRAAMGRFPASAFWFAGAELVFSGVWMAVAQVPVRPGLARRPWLTWFLALVTASNLLYHFPPLMGVIGKLASNPRWATDELIDRPALLRLAARPEVLALWAHFVLASIAVAAIVALWPARDLRDSDSSDGDGDGGDRVYRRLAGAALVASLLQLPVGAWVLVSTSGPARGALMGSDAVTSGLFLAGIVAAVGLLYSLGEIAMGGAEAGLRRRAGWLLVAVALLMSGTLTASRRVEVGAREGSARVERVPDATPLPSPPHKGEGAGRISIKAYFGSSALGSPSLGSGSFWRSSSLPLGHSPFLMTSS